MANCDKNIPDYIVLPKEGGGVPGPPGPPGPQGPPGIGELPVPATDVSVTNPGYANAQEIFDELLYLQIDINNFDATKELYEIGESISSLGFNWSLNKSDIISQVIIGAHNENGAELGITTRNYTITFSPDLSTTSTFGLRVDDGKNTTIKNKTINFINGIYFGNSVNPGTIDSNFIKSLNRVLQSEKSYNFTSNAGNNVYVWYANRVALGIASFKFGGFTGGMEPPIIISFTNSSGFTEDYYVYRSTNPQIGVVNIEVS